MVYIVVWKPGCRKSLRFNQLCSTFFIATPINIYDTCGHSHGTTLKRTVVLIIRRPGHEALYRNTKIRDTRKAVHGSLKSQPNTSVRTNEDQHTVTGPKTTISAEFPLTDY